MTEHNKAVSSYINLSCGVAIAVDKGKQIIASIIGPGIPGYVCIGSTAVGQPRKGYL